MNRSENFVIGTIIFALIASFSLYGVWEDKIGLFGPLLTLLYLAMATWAVAAVASGGHGRNSGRKSHISGISLPPGWLPLLFFWLYSLVMIPFSVIPYEAKISTLRVGAYLGVYWTTASILSRFPRRKAVLMTVLLFLVLTALYSLVQHKVAPNIIFGMERYAEGYWKNGRLGGTYQCPNHIAHLFQMWVPFCLMFLVLPQFGWFWRICFGYSIPLFVVLIYQTQSRAGLLGLVTGLATTILLLMLRKSRRLFYIALLVVPLIGAGAVGGLWFGSSMFRERMQPVVKFINHQFSGADIKDEFKDFRPQTWADSMVMIKDRPLFGFGPGNYGLTFPEYRQRVFANRMLTVHPHNEYVEMLSEYGLVGGTLVLWALISLCVQMVRMIRTSDRPTHALPAIALLAALAGTAVHGFFDFELRIFPNALILALLAGCAVAPAIQTLPQKRPKQNAVAQWAFSTFLVLSAVWSLQVMSSAILRVWGDKFRLAQNRPKAETLYKAATTIDPQNWDAHLGLGQIYSYYRYYELDLDSKQEWANKERAVFASAYRHNTKKEEIVYGLGRTELALGNRKAGLDYLRQAARYKRFNDYYWRKLGIELRKDGFYEEALEVFFHARRLDRWNKTVKRNIQWIKENTKRGK